VHGSRSRRRGARRLAPRLAPRLARRLARATGGLLTAVLLVGLALTAVGHLVFHVGVSPVLTGSMVPTYRPGDAILTRLVPVSSLHPGEIAVFVPPGESAPFAHRLVTVTGDRNAPVVTTRGDANKAADPWHAKLLGPDVRVVVGVIPDLGRALVAVRTPRARALLLALLGLLITAIGTAALLRPSPAQRRAHALPT